jgi:hypothetical protein
MKYGSKHYLMTPSFGLIHLVAMPLVPYEKQSFEGFLPYICFFPGEMSSSTLVLMHATSVSVYVQMFNILVCYNSAPHSNNRILFNFGS